MSTQPRPTWADSLLDAISALKRPGAPLRPLVPLVGMLAGRDISPGALANYLQEAEENDPALTQVRIALAHWDSEELCPAGEGTLPLTEERRQAVESALALPLEVADALKGRVPLFRPTATTIATEFEPWYQEDRATRKNLYWDDYEAYLRDVKKWPADSITSLDETSTEVVQRLSRPTRAEARQTKGLVVGYVQSGKTANFTGVAAKAIDAGYRLVIVLSGTIEILRAQTQRRMDMELVGVENVLAGLDPLDPAVSKELDYQTDEDWRNDRFVRHGELSQLGGVVGIQRVTTHRSDYKRLPHGMSTLKFAKKNKQLPLNDPENLFDVSAYLAVVKKNAAPLRKLIQDLKPLKSELAELPVLIIDDESDQASVDTTNPAKWKKDSKENRQRTRINSLITELLGLCPRAQYVGYTATPFANVFVDPDDERDLFPSDFVISLQRPPGYMGVQEFHDVGKRWDDERKSVANSNELAYVRPITDGHRADGNAEAADGLAEAIDAWVLAGAIKKFREEHSSFAYRHHTMLVHESVKKGEHAATAEQVRAHWRLGQFVSSQGHARLRALFASDFLPVMRARGEGAPIPDSFDELRPYVARAIAQMTIDGDPVLIVNSDKEILAQQKKLDFESESVWRILVGGTQLSRGFTVEGLTVSYFRRKPGQADTLMQAGRWFGFRPGYQDLVRLYILRDPRADLYEAFEALLLDEEAFRAELQKYAGFDEDGMPTLEPRQIPPLVSQHLPWLKPTARNKMWNAVIANRAPVDIQDLYGLPDRGDARNAQNFESVIVPLLRCATLRASLPYELDGKGGAQSARLGLISAKEFLELFAAMQWRAEYEATAHTFEAFIRAATDRGDIEDWAVVWPQPATGGKIVDIPELGGPCPVVKRSRRPERHDFVGSDRKHRAAARPIVLGDEVAQLGRSDKRGVVLVLLVPDSDPDVGEPARAELVGLMSIATPDKAVPKSHLIQWTAHNSARPTDVVVDRAPED